MLGFRCELSPSNSAHDDVVRARCRSNPERTSDQMSQEYGMSTRILPAAGRDLVAWIWRGSAPSPWRTRFAPSSSPPLPRDRDPRGTLRRRDRPRRSRRRRAVRIARNADAAHGRGAPAGHPAPCGQPVSSSHATGPDARDPSRHRPTRLAFSLAVDAVARDRGALDRRAGVDPLADKHTVRRRLRR